MAPGNLAPGTWLGRYRIDESLGSGGMGTVLGAWDDLLGRPVALKVLHREDARGVFDEARAMAAVVHHPNVVNVYAVEQVDEVVFVVMEPITGTPLDVTLAARGRLEPETAVEIVDTLASALTELHSAGLVHGDVKPSNVLIEEPSGRLVLTDFGLARAFERSPKSASFRGTPEYLCPEQGNPEGVPPELRARQDVYALACTAFELLTGCPPYEAEAAHEVLFAHARAEIPRATHYVPSLPWRVDAVLAWGLAKDPALRAPTPRSFAEALATAVQRGGEAPRFLVVEDHPIQRNLVATTLTRKLGGTMECARDGESGYAAALAQRPDLVITDLAMPRTNGLELVAMLRATPGLEMVPIVVLSGLLSPPDLSVLEQLGVSQFLSKPAPIPDLTSSVSRALGIVAVEVTGERAKLVDRDAITEDMVQPIQRSPRS